MEAEVVSTWETIAGRWILRRMPLQVKEAVRERLPSSVSPAYYSYQVELEPFPAVLSLEGRGVTFTFSAPPELPWLLEGVQEFTHHCSPGEVLRQLPLAAPPLQEVPPPGPDLFGCLYSEASASRYKPLELFLLLLFQASFLPRRSFYLLGYCRRSKDAALTHLSGSWWLEGILSPEAALTLLSPSRFSFPAWAIIAVRRLFTTVDQGWPWEVPPTSLLATYNSGEEEAFYNDSLSFLYFLLAPACQRRWEEAEALYRRVEEQEVAAGLPRRRGGLYNLLTLTPWPPSLLSEEAWKLLLELPVEEVRPLVLAVTTCYQDDRSFLSPEELLRGFLQEGPLSEKEVKALGRQEVQASLPLDALARGESRFLVAPFLRLLLKQEVQALSPEERGVLCSLYATSVPEERPVFFTMVKPLLGKGETLLLSRLWQELGGEAALSLLLSWEAAPLTSEGWHLLLSHPEWVTTPRSWWVPLLEEAEG